MVVISLISRMLLVLFYDLLLVLMKRRPNRALLPDSTLCRVVLLGSPVSLWNVYEADT